LPIPTTLGTMFGKQNRKYSHLLAVLYVLSCFYVFFFCRIAPPTNVEYIELYAFDKFSKVRWPSGLRRNVKAVVFIGACSNHARIRLSFGLKCCESKPGHSVGQLKTKLTKHRRHTGAQQKCIHYG
jgi:hypothetical protein